MSKRAWNFVDLTGEKFGKLLVIKDSGKNYEKNGRVCPIFLCRCDCGQEKEISSNSLRAGAESCNCTKGIYKRKPVIDSQFAQILARYRIEAKQRDLLFELTREQFMVFIKQPCFYCSRENSCFVRDKKDPNKLYLYNGIDRVDNEQGYKEDNCVTCCKPCNSKKKSTSKEMIVKAYNFLKDKGKI